MNVVHVLGMKLPVLKSYRDRFYLVAHPNGPAIVRPSDDPNGGLMTTLSCDFEEVPKDVIRFAIDDFIDLAWPLMKAKYEQQP